jgi:hypothetical protein
MLNCIKNAPCEVEVKKKGTKLEAIPCATKEAPIVSVSMISPHPIIHATLQMYHTSINQSILDDCLYISIF